MAQEVGKAVPASDVKTSKPESHGTFKVLRLSGRLDASAAQGVQKQCSVLRHEGASHLALELSQVTFVSSSGLGVFLALTEEFKEANGSFRLVSPSSTVAAVIKLLNLDRFLSIAPSVEHLLRD